MKQPNFSLLALDEPKKIAAIIVFALAFFAFLWEIISAFFTNEQINRATNPPDIISTQAPIRADSPLFTTALFGNYIPANLSEAEIKQSMLDVQVVGIMYSPQEKESLVTIRAAGGEEKTYGVGDELPGGAIIKRISEKGIVVLHNGALESLSLPNNELRFDPPAKPLIGE